MLGQQLRRLVTPGLEFDFQVPGDRLCVQKLQQYYSTWLAFDFTCFLLRTYVAVCGNARVNIDGTPLYLSNRFMFSTR